MARKTKKGKVVSVDFSDVQSNMLLPEVQGARLKVLSGELKDNDNDGSIVTRIEVVDCDIPKIIGKATTIYFNLGATSLWVLRNFLDALGVEVPEGAMDIDLEAIEGLEFVADITQNTYNDRTTNRLANFQPTDGSEAEEEDDDEVVVKGKKSKAKDEDEDEEEEKPRKKSKKVEEDDDEDEEEKPRKKSKKVVDEDEDEDEDEAPKKKSKRVVEEDEDDDEDEAPKSKKKSRKDEDDEDEEDDAPKSKKKAKGVKYAESEVREMDDKELKSLVRKHDLDVDLDDYSNTRKKALAVIDALEENDLIEND